MDSDKKYWSNKQNRIEQSKKMKECNPMQNVETREKVKNTLRHTSPFKKLVEKIDPKTKKCLGIYSSINEASRITGISITTISKVCLKKKYRKTAGGFIWRFV